MQHISAPGRTELWAAATESWALIPAVIAFSVVVNVLMLSGPLYMLQVYDRVIPSGSEPTLVALTGLLAFFVLIMGLLDHARSRVMSRLAARFQDRMDRRVFAATMQRLIDQPGDPIARAAQRDLEAVQHMLASPVLLAVFDIPWTPVFVAAIFVFHPYLGLLAVAGGGLLIAITLLNKIATRAPITRTAYAAFNAEHISEQLKGEAELVQSLGMRQSGFDRWQIARIEAQTNSLQAGDRGGAFATLSKTLRLFLQSAMLGMGALLVLRGMMSAGAMIAGSVLLSRALAPIETAISQWTVVQRGQLGWSRLQELLDAAPPAQSHLAMPRPRAILEVQHVTVIPPGEHQAALRMLSFRLEPGTALGVIGSSASGKSTLARTLTGIWRPAGGKVRLDGAALDSYDPDILASYIGYLPQRVSLFDGTIAENIARLSESPDSAAVVAAAQAAGAHEMILELPDAYNTRISAGGGRLSGGQIQRIGLARAMYGDPLILILDEPNSNLDNEGSQALNTAIRRMKAAGKTVLVMAHRPAAIQECDQLLLLEGGARRAFGPRDTVLREIVRNHTDILRSANQGGVA